MLVLHSGIQLMSNPVYAPPGEYSQSAVPGRRFRWKSGVILLALGIVGTFVANRVAGDDTDKIIRVLQGIGLTLAALLIWWVFFSGIKFWVRLAVVGVVFASLAVTLTQLVRKVDFEGDMRPHFWFVWDPPSPSEKAQQWLNENAPPVSTAASDTTDASDSGAVAETKLTITAEDWPRFCGHTGSREISEPQCSFDWNTHPPKELWRHPVGDAWSSFSIVGTRLFTQEQRGPQECVVCYNADTGEELWRHEDTARYETPQGAIGPRATPTITEDAVFSLGATGILNALNPITGAKLWQRNICTDAGSEMVEWGMSSSPLIYEDTVIVDAGGDKGKAVIAYNRQTGDIVWASGNHKAGYASPRIEMINGSLQLLVFHGDGLQGLEPSTGKMLWEYPWTNQYKINVAQPLLFGNQIFLSSGYDSGCVLIAPTKLTDGQPAEVWPRKKTLKLKFNEAVQLGDYVYGLDDGILACIDYKTGERTWKGGRYRYGQLLLWGDKLIVQSEAGYVAVVEANPKEFREVTRLEALNDRTWNMLMINRGRLYTRNASEAVCFELPKN